MYPNTFYRVSVKALIKNNQGRVLVLKENQDTWSIPGGGLNHGEDPIVALKRELKEELGIEAISDIRLFSVKTFYLETKQAWLMWVVYTVKIPEDTAFKLGKNVTEATFLDYNTLKHGDIFERSVYAVSSLREENAWPNISKS